MWSLDAKGLPGVAREQSLTPRVLVLLPLVLLATVAGVDALADTTSSTTLAVSTTATGPGLNLGYSLTGSDIAVIVLYFLVLVCIGFTDVLSALARRLLRRAALPEAEPSSASYFLASREMGPIAVAASLFAVRIDSPPTDELASGWIKLDGIRQRLLFHLGGKQLCPLVHIPPGRYRQPISCLHPPPRPHPPS